MASVWRRLGVGTAIARALGARGFATDVERVLFELVANGRSSRSPSSRRPSRPAATCRSAGWPRWNAHRAMDVLPAAADVEMRVWR
jgi:hypothetical protein